MSTALTMHHARPLGGGEPVDLVLRDGRIAQIRPSGSASGVDADADATGEHVDLEGRTLMPGLWDAHVHMTQWALARLRMDLSTTTSAAHTVRLVSDRLATHPPVGGAPLVGFGYHDGLWPDVPSAALLDAAVGHTSVILVAGDLHSAWLSTAALRQLGIEHPTGVLRETEWMPLSAVVDHVDDAAADAAVADAARAAAAKGVVGIVDYEITENLGPWRRRTAAGLRTLRVRAGVWEPHLEVVYGLGLRTGDPVPGTAGLVTQGPLKVVSDGSLNTRTAFCADPYPGVAGPDAYGLLNVPPERLVPLLREADAHGLSCAVHAIGDRANTLALDAFAASGARGSVEHAQLLDPADIARFAALGVTASVQPEHAMDDRDVADRYWAGRTHRAYAYGALAAAGVHLVLGSDAPVARLDPWAEIAAAVTRTRDGRAPWHPEQAMDLRAALEASVDGRPLTLAVGDVADLAVLDADPLSPGASLRDMPVAGTLLGGRWTHRTF